MCETHAVPDEYGDVAGRRPHVWIDKAERRVWFLFKSGRSS
jgi:starvation-inducible DNA-binding protein